MKGRKSSSQKPLKNREYEIQNKQRRRKQFGKIKRENIPLREIKQMGGKEVGMVQLFSVMDMPRESRPT